MFVIASVTSDVLINEMNSIRTRYDQPFGGIMILLKLLGVVIVGGYTFARFEPSDRIVDVICPDQSICYFYEEALDSLPFDSLVRTDPFEYFTVPEWLTGDIRDEYGQLYLLCVGAIQIEMLGYRHILLEGEDPGRTAYRLEIFVDDSSGRTLWITLDHSKLRLMTWPEFLCECFLDSDLGTNPPRVIPNENGPVYEVTHDYVLLEGIGWYEEWLMVKPMMESPEAAGFETAWIRWVKDDSLLVDYHLMY